MESMNKSYMSNSLYISNENKKSMANLSSSTSSLNSLINENGHVLSSDSDSSEQFIITSNIENNTLIKIKVILLFFPT
jgi:hypothetical protein